MGRKFSRRDILRAGLGTAAGAVLAGCVPPAPGVVETGAEEPRPAPVRVGGLPVPRDETVIINETAILRIFESANPFVPNAMVGGWDQVCAARLFYLNWASGEEVAMLGESYEYNDDYTELTIKTRPEAHWNDGHPFTSHDIEFTVNMVKANLALSWGATMDQWVDTMEVPDDHTIAFKLRDPNPRFHWYSKQAWSMPIVAKHEWEGQDPMTYKAFPPVGTGPYKWHSAIPELRMVVWERDEDFWGKALGYEVGPKYYVYQTGPTPEAEMADLQDNYIDHAHSYTSDAALLRQSQELNPEVVLAPWRDPCPRGIWFNCAKYPLSLPEVRWAFFYCIDREKAASVLYPWPTVPAKYPFADWGSNEPFMDIYDEILEGFDIGFDPEKGARILDELGFERGPDGIRVDGEGNKMSYEIIVPAHGVTGEYPIAVDFAEHLGEIGVQASVKWVEGAVFDDRTSTGQFDITSHWFCGNWYEPPMTATDWQSWRIKPVGERATAGNWVRLDDPEMDEITAELEVTPPDSPAVEDLYRKVLLRYTELMPVVPVVQTTYVMPFNTHYWEG